MNHTWEITDVCGDTHIFRDRSIEEAFGKIGPLCSVKRDGDPGKILQLPTGRLVFFPDRIRLTRYPRETEGT
jgi:hypothetical protein